MARYYVEKDGEWNIFSTIIDDFLFDEFICLDALKARLLYERFKELTEDMDSLLTDNPRVNVMTYSEAIERKQADTPQTDCPFKDVPCSCGEQDECEWHTELDTPQTKHYDYSKSEMENIKCGNGITTEIPQNERSE